MFKRVLHVRRWLMSCLYKRIVRLWRQWYWLTLALIVAAILLTWHGLAELNKKEYSSTSTELYQALKTLVMASPAVDADSAINKWLEWGRWLGAIVFFGGVLGLVSRLFSQSALSLFTWMFASKHVILAGLGQPSENNDKLVMSLRREWKSVIIIEPDPAHPQLEACRNAGAVVLIGSPYEEEMLRRARIHRAESIILLSGTDRENMGLAYLTYKLLNDRSPRSRPFERIEHPFQQVRPDQVSCLLGVIEPSLVDVIRHDRIYTDSHDRLRLNVFCLREMVARAMLRETRLLENPRPLGNILIVGLGLQLRLGEALVTRAAKDWHINRNDKDVTTSVRLVIDVIDGESENFVQSVTSRVSYIKKHDFPSQPTEVDACFLRAIPRKATRCGFRGEDMRAMLMENQYDAIFVCLADEGMAVRQGIELRQTLDEIPGSENVTVVVRVMQEDAGFGPLLSMEQPGADGALRPKNNLIAVGFRDRIQDVMLSLNPEVEMLAHVIHQQYLLTLDKQLRDATLADPPSSELIMKLRNKKARRSWNDLHESLRQSNRDQAIRLSQYIDSASHSNGSSGSFELVYAPHEALSPELGLGLSDEQITELAIQEHNNWVAAQLKAGWKLDRSLKETGSDPDRKLSPFLVPWNELDEGTKKYDIDVIARLAITFAKADYRLSPK